MRCRFLVSLVALVALPGQAAPAQESVTFASHAADGARLTAYLHRPEASEPAPAVVALHGCGGLFNRRGELIRRHADWADRLVAAGYVVMFPDSFRSRGFDSVCETRERQILPRDRGGDAAAAADWLAQQPFVNAQKIAVLGWSHGGSSVLWAVGGRFRPERGEWRAAIAFYPGCRTPAHSTEWAPRLEPYVLIGSADDWTPPQPCRGLAERGAIRLIEYTGAVHGFDAPSTPRRTRTGVAYSARGDGKVEIGTDPKARAASIKEVMTILRDAFR